MKEASTVAEEYAVGLSNDSTSNCPTASSGTEGVEKTPDSRIDLLLDSALPAVSRLPSYVPRSSSPTLAIHVHALERLDSSVDTSVTGQNINTSQSTVLPYDKHIVYI